MSLSWCLCSIIEWESLSSCSILFRVSLADSPSCFSEPPNKYMAPAPSARPPSAAPAIAPIPQPPPFFSSSCFCACCCWLCCHNCCCCMPPPIICCCCICCHAHLLICLQVVGSIHQ